MNEQRSARKKLASPYGGIRSVPRAVKDGKECGTGYAVLHEKAYCMGMVMVHLVNSFYPALCQDCC